MFYKFYPEDYLPPGRVEAYMRILPRVVFHLRWINSTRHLPPNARRFTLFDLASEGIFDVMPRTKKQQPKPDNSRTSRSRPAANETLVWANVRLSDDDVAYLTEHQFTYEECGALLLALVDKGYNFSVKCMDDGETIMCAITGYVDDLPQSQMGVSAFAATSLDAAHACLYKFDQLLGGSFRSEYGAGERSKPRFR